MKKSPLSLFAQLHRIHTPGRFDLHAHSTCSDGTLSPLELLQRARQLKLDGLAITDHDSTAADPIARAALQPGEKFELVSGVEMTCSYDNREVHLLGYGIDPRHPELCERLQRVRLGRTERFLAMVDQLAVWGAPVDAGKVARLLQRHGTVGRRHLGELLVEAGHVSVIFYAFVKYLNRPEIAQLPKPRVPIAEGIALIHAAGGFASWAHPPADVTLEQVRHWQALGLDALEAEYPWSNPSQGRKVRALAAQVGLAVTGGSDFHTPDAGRNLGCKAISRQEWERAKAARAAGVGG